MTFLVARISGSGSGPIVAGLLSVLVGVAPAGAASPNVEARNLYREAAAAAGHQDYAKALGLLERAAALRPDHPRYLGALAQLQALNKHPLDAIATLGRLARTGLSLDPGINESFAGLPGNPAFGPVLRSLRANRSPLGAGQVLFELPAMTGIIEGIAFRPQTGNYFFGDVRHRCVWVRRPNGSVQQFSPPAAGLFGVFGLAVDEPRGALWAATTALPEMDGFQPADRNHAALVEFALTDGSVRRMARLPADGAGHVLGDLILAPDGTVYATDSNAPVIWRLPPGARQPVRWIQSDEFVSLQGLAFTPDRRALLVADYANGLFRIDLATRAIRFLAPPVDTTLVGIDGLVVAPDGSAVAVQNGIDPRRIVRLWFDPAGQDVTRLEVLERGHPVMADPSLGALAGKRYVFIGESGWDRFGSGGPPDAAAPRAVSILVNRLAAPRGDR